MLDEEDVRKIYEQLATDKTKLDMFERWQHVQNGALTSLDQKMDELEDKFDKKLNDLNKKVDRLHDSFAGLYKWLAGIAIAWILQAILTMGLLK